MSDQVKIHHEHCFFNKLIYIISWKLKRFFFNSAKKKKKLWTFSLFTLILSGNYINDIVNEFI